MPAATYEQLLRQTLPAVIETDEEYEGIHRRFSILFDRRDTRTPGETKLMRLLGLLIQDYDRRHAMPPGRGTPAEVLRFLLEHSGRKPADLLAIFGQRSHVNEALNGKRQISAAQARKLGALFSVNPGLFI